MPGRAQGLAGLAPWPLSSARSTMKEYLSTRSQVRAQMIIDVVPSTASSDGRGESLFGANVVENTYRGDVPMSPAGAAQTCAA